MKSQSTKYKRILGVDPGTNVMGYAIIEVRSKELHLIDLGTVNMQRNSDQHEKLKQIFQGLHRLIRAHQPNCMAIEAPFYGKNVQSMLKLGRAQGVAIAVALINGLATEEFAPKKIKQSITGSGNAAKEQVAAMLETIFKIKLDAYPLDATDALATAVCYHFQAGNPIGGNKKYSDWGSFLKANPGKKL